MSDRAWDKLEAALEELSLAVMVLDLEDLEALGDLHNLLESVLAEADKAGDESIISVCRALLAGAERAITGDVDDPDEFTGLISEITTDLQGLVRSASKSGQAGPLSKELGAKLARIADQDGAPAAEPKAAPEPAPEPEPQATAKPVEEERQTELPSDLDVDLAGGFISESLDLLQEIEVAILEVEKDPEDPDTINAIFRPFHTIKGVSGFLNLTDINRFAHQVENLLDEARGGRITLEGPVIDLILDAVDLLRVMISDLSTMIGSGETAIPDYGINSFIVRIKAVHEAAIKAMAGDPAPLGQILVAQGDISPGDLETGLKKQEEVKKPLGAVLVEDKKVSPKAVARGLRDQKAASAEVRSVKVDTAKLDNMVDAVGELVIALSLVAENPKVQEISDRNLERDMAQLGRIISELQKTAMSLRMVPIKQTFQRMGRVVRDLSRKSGKPAELTLEGADTEIDRTMVDAIYDPMVHMVRNSMDHGLEEKDGRRAANKSETGSIAIRAYHQGGKIVIEIEDDGKGLDPDIIFNKAVERGLVSPEAKMSDSEIHQLILQAGFSTAEKITDISGRGVGMDVVRESVEKLRGNLEIHSVKGEGSKFIIRLPLTMAIIEGMVVRVGGERFIIPALGVQEVLKPEEGAFNTAVGGKGEMVMVRGSLLPLVRLGPLFGVPSAKDDLSGVIVVVESEGQSKAVMVDDLLGKQEVVIKSLGAAIGQLKGLSGGAILGDGRVGLIVDIAGLFIIAETEGGGAPLPSNWEAGVLEEVVQEAAAEIAPGGN